MVLATLMTLLATLLLSSPATAVEAVPTTYQGAVYPAGVNPPSADKPQSKLWYQDGAWWALMLSGNTSTVNVFELRGTAWVDTGTQIDNRPSSTADALWDNGKLYVASRTSSGSLKVTRFSYDSATRAYQRDAGFPVTAAGGGSETVTIARDTTGRVWITYTQSSDVWVAHSTTSESTWAAPFRLPVPDASVSSDDISAVLSFGTRIGVMFSDQVDGVIRFAVHKDGDPVTTWTAETALAGPSMADDHINIKSITGDDSGAVYAAVKTSRNLTGGATDPIIVVLKRTAVGGWSAATAGQVRDDLTRAQIAVDNSDPAHRVLYVLATAPEAGGIIYYKRAPVDALVFPAGRGEPFISWAGASINNVSVGKDPVTAATGLVAIATDGTSRRYYTGVLPLGTPSSPPADTVAPTVPQDVVASAPDPTRVQVSWSASTDAVGVTSYSVMRDGVQVGSSATTTFSDSSVEAGSAYFYAVRARDAAGNVSAASAAVSVTVPTAPERDSEAPSVPADVTATAPDSTQVHVQWSASTDGAGVTGYSVLRDGVEVGSTASTSFSDTSVSAGATYAYAVRARDAAGNLSAASPPAAVTVPVASAAGPAFRSASTGRASSTTALVLPTPTGTVAGDVMLAVISARGPHAPAAAGWTLVRSDAVDTTITQAVFRRTATAAEPATSTWRFSSSVSGVAGQVLAYVGVSGVATHAGARNTTASTTVTAPSASVTAGQLVVVVSSLARNAELLPPSGLAQRSVVSTPGNSKVTAAGSDTLVASTQTLGPFQFVASASAVGIGQTVVLDPAG